MEKPEEGNNIASYKLPICDTQKDRRNFKGFEKNQYYNLADIQDINQSGTTDTDSVTDPGKDKGAASIYKKKGKGKQHGGKKLDLSQPSVPGTRTFGGR